jgi:Fe-S-cluster containining protein
MKHGSEPQASSAEVRLVISVNGRPVRIELRVPDRAARLDELLPALRHTDDRLIDAAVANVEADGERVSCAKGCSACCRAQPVPVTPPEAFALARLVEALPEPRRTAVNDAFGANVQRLRQAGLYDTYMRREAELTRDEAKALSRRYMALALSCPFLQDDACSIYAERPFVCRQYLVTSPAQLCAAPLDNPVKPIGMPATFATAMLQAGETFSGRPQHSVPLALSLDYAQANRAELERTYAGKSVFEQVARAALVRS